MSEEKSTSAKVAEDKKSEKKIEVEKDISVEVPEKFKKIVEEIEKMSVLDLSELVKILEEKFGVSASAPMMAAPMAQSENTEEEVEEKSSFDIEITEAGANKISVIKAIREISEIGLKDAKDLVDAAPKIVKEGVAKEEAEVIKKKLEEAGAKVTLK
ncbi:MAG: 50S ribosomal protein L7/L12 [Xanthomonadaceae bacterium]|nr:50S ribosomal protein L7/L12 [Rhodospirillaceae bacterium]NIA17651.1 50S ribosomal protein L7/L12 [Xanthomonadaceae bacterium]